MKLVMPLAISSALLFCGCAWQDLPVDLYIDSTFSNVERQAIADAAQMWNDFAGRCLAEPGPVILISGVYEDEFNENDYGDERHVVYRISEPGTDAEFLAEDNVGHVIGGNAGLGDVVLFMYRLDSSIVINEQLAAETGYLYNSHQARYDHVFNLAVHEFGHLLGLAHVNCYHSTMNAGGEYAYDVDGHRYLTKYDIRAFCEVYDCCRSCE